MKAQKDFLCSENDPIKSINDISQLMDTSKENVVSHLHKRFKEKKIYSTAGSLLIAINPYDMNVNELYSKDITKAFHGNINTIPHVFLIAEQAYNFILNKNATIIISGESGSGKTTCTEKILSYLIKRTRYTKKDDIFNKLRERILALDEIFEKIGNAKTAINDNSSRFGKLITLFYKNMEVTGAKIETYLLEKSRITHADYNFHVFYDFATFYNLEVNNLYLQSHKKKGKGFDKLLENLKFFNIEKDKIEYTLICIIFLGDILFEEEENEVKIKENIENKENSKKNSMEKIIEKFLIKNEEIFLSEKISFISSFLQIEEQKFIDILLTTEINICGEVIFKKNNKEKAEKIRDTISKNIYLELFEFIINSINTTLSSNYDRTISILDIYGFENFELNCFEQFCINWVNERIQDEFMKDFYEDQAQILEAEGLREPKENKIENRSIVLIETPNGIADRIIEESLLQTNTLDLKINELLSIEKQENPQMINENSFKLKHYAGDVSYSTNKFREKNSETNNFQDMLKMQNKSIKGNTIVDYFRKSLNSLFSHIKETKTFYIKCVKPSSNKTSEFDEKFVTKQLESTGLINMLDLCKNTFFQNIKIAEFERRYNFLFFDKNKYQTIMKCNANEYVKGQTRIFLKQKFFNLLEKERLENKKEEEMVRHFFSLLLSVKLSKRNIRNLIIDKKNYLNKEFFEIKTKVLNNLEVRNKERNKEKEKNQNIKEVEEKFKTLNTEMNLNKNYVIKENDKTAEIVARKKNYINFENIEKSKENFNSEISNNKNQKKEEKEMKIPNNKEIDEFKDVKNFLIKDIKKSKENSLNFISLDEIKIQKNYDLEIKIRNIFLAIKLFLKFTPIQINMKEKDIFCLSNSIFLESNIFSNNKEKKLEYLKIFIYACEKTFEDENLSIEKMILMLSNVLNLQSQTISFSNFSYFLFNEILQSILKKIEPLLPNVIFTSKGSNKKGLLRFLKRKKDIKDLIKIITNFYTALMAYKIPEEFVFESLDYILKEINYITFNSILVSNDLDINEYKNLSLNLKQIEDFLEKINYREGILNLSHLREFLFLLVYIKSKNLKGIEDLMILNSLHIKNILHKLGIHHKIALDTQKDLFVKESNINYPPLKYYRNFNFDKDDVARPKYFEKKEWNNFLKLIKIE